MKKPIAPAARSIFGVRSDALDLLFAVDENTGSALTQKAPVRNSNFGNALIYNKALGTGTPITTAWTTNADGRCLDLNNGGTAAAVRLHASLAADQTLTQGTLLKVFRIPTTGGALARWLMRSNQTTSATNTLRMLRTASSSDVRLIIENGATDLTYEWLAQSTSNILILIARWGPRGFYAWINGVAGTVLTGSPTTHTGGILTQTGNHWDLGDGTNGGIQEVSLFARWQVELEDWEIEKLWADTYHPVRAMPSKLAVPGCWTGVAKTTSVKVKTITPIGFSGTLDWGVWVGSNVNSFDSPTATFTASTSTAEAGTSITVTGLGLASRTPILPFWNDGVNNVPLPIGLHWATTQNYVVPASGEPEVLNIHDDHVNSAGDGGLQTITGFGRDIMFDPASATIQNQPYEGTRKQYYAWMGVQAAMRMYKPSFVRFGGDNLYFDVASGNGTADTNNSMFAAGIAWWQVFGHILSLATSYMIPGNHERLGKPWMMETNGTLAIAKQAMRYWKIFTNNPNGTDYAEGGEASTEADYLPAEGAIPAAFVAGATYAVGDVCKPTGSGDQSKTRGYRCAVGGVAGADNSSGWSRTLGATVTTGAVTFEVIYRYDSEVASLWMKDAAGNWQSPYHNYWAFTWADVLFVFMDSILYQAWRDGQSSADTPSDYMPGEKQRVWYEGVLAASSAPVKEIFIHHLLGGEYIGADGGTGNYARSSGQWINVPAVFAAQGITESPYEIRMDRVAKRWGADISKNHDHTAGLCTSSLGVRYWTGPALAAENMFDETNSSLGWNNERMADTYGTSESLGTVDFTGDAMPRTVYRYNVLGFTYDEYDPSLSRLRKTTIQTGLSFKRALAGFGPESSIVRQTDSERWINNANIAPDGSDIINLADALNISPRPMFLGLVVNASAITGTWYTTPPQTFVAADASNEAWIALTPYAEFDSVRPTTFNGTMAFAWQAGTSHATTEPVWPAIGNTIPDGTVNWIMGCLFPVPYTQFALFNRTNLIQLDASVSTSVRAEYVPRIVKVSDWYTQAADPSINLAESTSTTTMFQKCTRTSVFVR